MCNGLVGSASIFSRSVWMVTSTVFSPLGLSSPQISLNSSWRLIATPGFFFESNVNYALYTNVLNIDTSNSLPAFGLTLRDGGAGADADAVPTELIALSLISVNAADIDRAALYDGGIELAEVAVTGSPITFSGLTVSATDGGTKDLTLYVTFKTTVTDNDQISFTVSSVTADGAGSGFAAANGGGAGQGPCVTPASMAENCNHIRLQCPSFRTGFGAPKDPAPDC